MKPWLLLPKKKVKKIQPAPEPRESVIPSAIPRRIKTRATKVNPKISEKEWAIFFTGNKEGQASSSSDSESTNDTPTSLFRKQQVLSTQLCPPPSLIHLERFKRVALREPLTDAQRFPLAFINCNTISETPYSKFISIEPIHRETISVQAPTWAKYDYMHMPSGAFKAFPTNVIIHLPLP